jgi:raffinose/stachyose/melibiose transport system permease protein
VNVKKIYPQYLLILPLLVYAVFFIFPSTVGFLYAFTDWNPYLDKISFVGLANFKEIFVNKTLIIAAENTVSFTVITALLKNVLGLVIAIALNRRMRTTNTLRAFYFLPVVFSALVVGLIFVAIFDTNYGVINVFLSHIGLENWAPEWLGNRFWGMVAVNITEIWRSTGYSVVICLAGLQSIPADYYEAADIDGASGWHKFKNVTLPLIMAPLNVNMLLSILYGLKIFDIVYIMTRGGPGHDTETFGTLILNEMASDRYAQSVAINLIFAIVLVIVAVAYQKFASMTEVEL